jgi:hypothetical protein
MHPTVEELTGTVLFVAAVFHTFLVSKFHMAASRYPDGSIGENFFNFLGEIEVVFGIWGGLFILFYALSNGFIITDEHGALIGGAVKYLNDLNFTEAAFVFVIMTIASTRPLLLLAERLIYFAASRLPAKEKISFYFAILTLGPLLGSLVTEPAAMTLSALLLRKYFFNSSMSERFKYATIGLLFVNVSIGGTLTNFAAPPVLMVAHKWGWETSFMFLHFGYKAVASVLISTLSICLLFRDELSGSMEISHSHEMIDQPPWWVTAIHVLSLSLVVYSAHYMVFFIGFFLFFLGFVTVAKEYQNPIELREPLLVGFFLAGLVTLGNSQSWWLKPTLAGMDDLTLFFGSTFLTSFTDNAALTYLGSLIDLSDSAKYSLVAGAVTGGGLTVIANAPNPAGYGILNGSFGQKGIQPGRLIMFALFPTVMAALCLQLLP